MTLFRAWRFSKNMIESSRNISRNPKRSFWIVVQGDLGVLRNARDGDGAK
jgi:hypothetical protein